MRSIASSTKSTTSAPASSNAPPSPQPEPLAKRRRPRHRRAKTTPTSSSSGWPLWPRPSRFSATASTLPPPTCPTPPNVGAYVASFTPNSRATPTPLSAPASAERPAATASASKTGSHATAWSTNTPAPHETQKPFILVPTMSRTKRIFVASGIIALLGGGGASCILHEANSISFLVDGWQWCAPSGSLSAWSDPGSPTPLIVNTCACIDDESSEVLDDWATDGGPPAGHPDETAYLLARDKVLTAAREACLAEADESGEPLNNCPEILHDDALLNRIGKEGECKREKLVSADTDTDSESSGDNPRPYDLTGLACGAGKCKAPRALIDDIHARPEVLALDSTRVEYDGTGLIFVDVVPGDLAYTVGLRTGDKLLSINGSPASDISQVAELLPGLRDFKHASVQVKDAYGDVQDLDLYLY